MLAALDWGGIVTGLWLPDFSGRADNVVLSLASLEAYLAGGLGFRQGNVRGVYLHGIFADDATGHT